jgi:hypothetical protein
MFYEKISDSQTKSNSFEAILNHARAFNDFLVATTDPEIKPDMVIDSNTLLFFLFYIKNNFFDFM